MILHTGLRVCACKPEWKHARMQAYTHRFIHSYKKHTNTQVIMRTYHSHTYIHTYIYTYIHACMHAYIHTYIHRDMCKIRSPINYYYKLSLYYKFMVFVSKHIRIFSLHVYRLPPMCCISYISMLFSCCLHVCKPETWNKFGKFGNLGFQITINDCLNMNVIRKKKKKTTTTIKKKKKKKNSVQKKETNKINPLSE